MTNQKLRELMAAATPGPWYHMQKGVEQSPPSVFGVRTWDWVSDHPVGGLHTKIIIERECLYGGADDYAYIVALVNSADELLDKADKYDAMVADQKFVKLGHLPEDGECSHKAYAELKKPRPRHCPACHTCMWDAGD